eukprot:SAG31_NODE_3626_length_4055_cov_16.812184_2_plen_71_part_00
MRRAGQIQGALSSLTGLGHIIGPLLLQVAYQRGAGFGSGGAAPGYFYNWVGATVIFGLALTTMLRATNRQ